MPATFSFINMDGDTSTIVDTPEVVQKLKNNEIDAPQIHKNKVCWIRQIEVILTSRKLKKSKKFSNEDEAHQYTMDISGSKYNALNKDKGTVSIWNLEYDEIVDIVTNEYYDIEIKAGYKSVGDIPTIFKGQVSYISQKIHSRHDVETYITYASEIVARYSQRRMNFNLNAGYNLYAAVNYICKISGLSGNANISPELKKQFLENVYNNYGTPVSVFDNLTSTSGDYIVNADYSNGNVISLFTLNDKRVIVIDPNTINIAKGNPTVTSAGLQICLLPTFNFMPGDIIQIDNSFINTSISNAESVYSTFNTNYLDRNGQYMIIDINYRFQNRGETFEFNIKGRALDIIKNIQGDNSITKIDTKIVKKPVEQTESNVWRAR